MFRMKNLSNQKIFITGGLGFIGSNVAKELLKHGCVLKIYDDFSSGSVGKLKRLGINPNSSRVNVIKGDILDKKKLEKEIRGSDVVIHEAAQLEIIKAVADPYFDLFINAVGTINVLNSMLKNKVPYLINASSACVYGQKKDSEIPTKETDFAEPNWPYGVSKLAAEKYCALYAKMYNLKIVSARYAIIYGQNEWYGRVMTIFIKNAYHGKPLIVYGDGKQKRDFTHVDDATSFNIKALDYILNSKTKDGFHQVFNVSTGKGTTINQLAKFVQTYAKDVFNNQVDIIYDKKVEEGKKSKLKSQSGTRMPDELRNMVLSNSKSKRILKLKPKWNLKSGLLKQMKWMKRNMDLWKA